METIDLSNFFATKAEASDFLSRITTIAEMIFQTNFNLEKALKEQLGINKSDSFLALLRDNDINSESLPAVKDFLKMLTEKIPTLPVLSLTIAFEPREQTLKALSEWFLVNMHQQMLFEITIDPQLVGGALINYRGKFSDFSVRPTVIRILENTLKKPTAPVVNQSETTHQNINDISFGR